MDGVLVPIIISGLIGVVIGAVIVWLVQKSPAGSTAALEKKHEEFRHEVSDHFLKTAELINRMTHSYKAVYDHLRDGARDLLDEETARKRLADTEREPVTLSLLERRSAHSESGSSKARDGGPSIPAADSKTAAAESPARNKGKPESRNKPATAAPKSAPSGPGKPKP